MLKLEHIQKSFDGVHILNDLSLEIPNGEIVSILGPSGSGKTTLLNLILGITEIDEGRILFNEQDMTHVPMEQRGFNIVFQDYALFPNLTAFENITYGLKNKPQISSPEEVQELVHLLGLEKHLEKRIDQLSGGQKQRVALARTLVMKPKILLLDEPTSALDLKHQLQIMETAKKYTKKTGSITVIVLHDIALAARYSDEILLLHDGYSIQQGIPEEVLKEELLEKIYGVELDISKSSRGFISITPIKTK